MFKKGLLISAFIIFTALIPGSGCNQVTTPSQSWYPVSDTKDAKPVIAINYLGIFTGQTASGFLKLAVDVNIENEGYQSFNTSPDLFSVIVDDYSYHLSDSDLPTVELADGDNISGKLIFQVPPAAATTRVGYKMVHSGQTLQNIRWLKQDNSLVSNPLSTPEVSITYSDSYMWVKESNSLYLLVDMTIENRGYESFNTSPEYFTLILSSIIGQSNPPPPVSFDGELSNEKDGAYSNLRSYDLQNGGKLNGTLAFKVSTDIFKSTERYRIDYSGVRAYNIRWSWTPPQK